MRVGLGLGVLLGVLVGTAATARDLRREEPRPTGCEAFGPGFRKIDGSDSCVRIGGSVQMESTITHSGNAVLPNAK